ncbi:MAG: enoyl-CoA hydratase/isomerase family protein [Desulfobacterales bacterium]|nr:MAG: enoyl-CoA hydratase/isomerase family protein [Desulfobacterales bacterium]
MSELKYHKIQKADGVARITFARPKHNVLNIDMMNEFNAELETLSADQDLKCLVIAGEGPSWCAGVEVADHKPALVDEMIATFNRIFELIDRIEVPTLAAVHGACLGGGLEVAIACDIIVAAQRALFGQPEIKLGFFPPYAAIRLPQLVGPAKAIEICTTGKRYTAAEAQAMGLISQAVDDQQLDEAVSGLVKEIQAGSPLIIRLNKRAVKHHLGMGFPQALRGVSDLFLKTLMQTEDTLEGIRSFEEKRQPVWKNR